MDHDRKEPRIYTDKHGFPATRIRSRFSLHGIGVNPCLSVVLSFVILGACSSPDTRSAAPPAADAERAIEAAAGALEAAPLDPARVADLARADLAAGRYGRAHALDLCAIWLLDHPATPAPAVAPERAYLDRAAAEAARGASAAAPAGSQTRERHLRSRDEALRLYGEKKYAQALEKLEKLTAAEDPKAPRWIASCHMKLAAAAADEGRTAAAVEHLWRAADSDAAARAPILYRDVARLERRASVELQGKGDAAGAVAALRRAFRAAPGDAETLYLLTRRQDLPAAEKAYYEALVAKLYPNRAEAEFVDAARRIREAPDGGAASAVFDRFAKENPAETALLADLRSILAERSTGEAARDAASARARYDSALNDARASRSAFESSFEPEGPGVAPPAAPDR
jgi:hypothetical protein